MQRRENLKTELPTGLGIVPLLFPYRLCFFHDRRDAFNSGTTLTSLIILILGFGLSFLLKKDLTPENI